MKNTLYRILDVVASICLAFDIDWETEYEDDEYVKRVKEMT